MLNIFWLNQNVRQQELCLHLSSWFHDNVLSVIICTYNPRPDYFLKALDALRRQTLRYSGWELVVIDNRCTRPLSDRFDFSWHPEARVIREEAAGLTMARLRGIRESTGKLL